VTTATSKAATTRPRLWCSARPGVVTGGMATVSAFSVAGVSCATARLLLGGKTCGFTHVCSVAGFRWTCTWYYGDTSSSGRCLALGNRKVQWSGGGSE
jgi:hypothetical protein